MSERHEGGCQCGAVRYSFNGPVPPAYACHCGECKKQTASAFSMSTAMEYDAVQVDGEVSVFETIAHSGIKKNNYFCGQCGTRLWHSATNPPSAITLKLGTLDNAADIAPVGHLWVSKKSPGFTIDPAAEQYQTQPDDLPAWRFNLGKTS